MSIGKRAKLRQQPQRFSVFVNGTKSVILQLAKISKLLCWPGCC